MSLESFATGTSVCSSLMTVGPSIASCAAAAAPAPIVAQQEESELPEGHDARTAYHCPPSSTSEPSGLFLGLWSKCICYNPTALGSYNTQSKATGNWQGQG